MIIGIAGYKGSGKDTAGSVLIQNYGFTRVSFAKPIKDLVSNMFGIDRYVIEGSCELTRELREDPKQGAYGLSQRKLLQDIGTGLRHIVHKDIWCDMLIKECDPNENYVITDVRFPNEVEAINKDGGFVIGIKRPGHNGDGHESEHALDNTALPYIVHNDGTMEDLKLKIDRLIGDKLRWN